MQKHIVRIPSRINYFISMSSLSTSVIKSYLPLNAKIFLLPNAIDFQKPERVKAEENHQFFAVGRLSPEKGFNLVAKATRNLEIEISFIGDGPEKERLAQINPSAHFYGWLPRHELATKLRLARAIIFSSKWYETQGLIISEAVSHGIPCIVSDSSAGRESIIDHQTGLLFTTNDEEDLSKKIKHLQTDDNVKFLSINAYNQFWSNPNIIEIYSKKIEEIYFSILEHEKVK
jgi:glycosyltransferase involved in cell wall biosynthesis